MILARIIIIMVIGYRFILTYLIKREKRDKFSFFIDRETEDLDMNTKKGSSLTQSVDKNTTTTSTGLRWNGRRGRSSLMVQSYYNHYKDTYDQYKRTGGIKTIHLG